VFALVAQARQARSQLERDVNGEARRQRLARTVIDAGSAGDLRLATCAWSGTTWAWSERQQRCGALGGRTFLALSRAALSCLALRSRYHVDCAYFGYTGAEVKWHR